jgi:serine/threonine protein phosphatase 1
MRAGLATCPHSAFLFQNMKNPMMAEPKCPYFQTYDFRPQTGFAGRLFAVGDIHGCYSVLETELQKVGFRKGIDQLISLGDLVDRGPESHHVEKWIDGESAAGNMIRVVGNHEELCNISGLMPDHGFFDHIRNGGKWYTDEISEIQTRIRISEKMMEAPYLLQITTPAGRTVGIAHASVPYNNWTFCVEKLGKLQKEREYKDAHPERKDLPHLDTQILHDILWCREDVDRIFKGGTAKTISGIEHVFFGHTPNTAGAVIHQNRSYIDTKAFSEKGHLTLIEIDPWLDFVDKLDDEKIEQPGGYLREPKIKPPTSSFAFA